jgi:hypothetical protein
LTRSIQNGKNGAPNIPRLSRRIYDKQAFGRTYGPGVLFHLRDEFPKRIHLDEILEIITMEIYDKFFTEAELKDLLAFYKSPTGRKFIAILPQISAEMLPRLGQLMDPPAALLATELLEDEIKRLTGKQN